MPQPATDDQPCSRPPGEVVGGGEVSQPPLTLRRSQPVRSCFVSRRGLVALALSTVLLAGCFTGERPYFSDADQYPTGVPTGDAAVDAVLTKLEAATAGPATAAYSILTKYGNVTNPALVVLSPGKRSVTVGNTRYIQTETTAVTCTEDKSVPCVDGFDPQRISDTSVTVDFYAADTAKRLRRDADAKLGPAIASTSTVAELPVTCVDVTVPGGVASYCVLDSGLVAKVDDGDVLITLTLFGEIADENAFVVPS